jgi:hypothetical protein
MQNFARSDKWYKMYRLWDLAKFFIFILSALHVTSPGSFNDNILNTQSRWRLVTGKMNMTDECTEIWEAVVAILVCHVTSFFWTDGPTDHERAQAGSLVAW